MVKANDGGYIVAEKAFILADVLLGYGIGSDSSFEEQFSEIYNKPSYGFDCGIINDNSTQKNKLYTFINQCIGNDKYIFSNQASSKQVTSFNTQMNNLNLNGKKIFIKMDIEGAEYEAFEGIYEHSGNITGIVLEMHFSAPFELEKAINLLKNLEKNFILVHIHSNNCTPSFTNKFIKGYINRAVELSFINKSLVIKYHISNNQKHPTSLDMPNCQNLPEAEFELLLSNTM